MRDRPLSHESGRRWVLLLGVTVIIALLAVLGVVVVNRFGGAGEPVAVEGIVGSEKVALFEDERVRARFAELGFDVRVRPRGSRLLAEGADEADFVSPGSASASEHVRELHGVTTEYQPFSTPMVLLSHGPVAEALEGAEVASRKEDGTWSFDLAAYLDLAGERTRWRDLPGNSVSSGNRNEVLVRTTDPRTSNSAAMYVVVLSYLLNDEEVVPPGDVDGELSATLSRLFLAQGQPPESSQQPFEQYRDLGAGHTPLLWAYESQYVYAAVAGPPPPEDAVLMYPEPTVYSTHTVVPFTDTGDEVGRLLTEDPELRDLIAEHGYRTDDTAHFRDLVDEHGLPVRVQVDDVVHSPTYEALEALLNDIEGSYESTGMAPPVEEDGRTGRRGGGRE
ncbi:hypothetical protein [Nocardiopsis ganjiahuensis]|uniref:hypothetical protein n=1 Tax=Nocardiopsis ganjiahuensis TaxID=239984 RepID=UPI000348F255|nr:hypothetical protein [Nocardiopsis ganjiahuensis]